VTREQFQYLLYKADEAQWTRSGIDIRQNGSRQFVDPKLTWDEFETMAKRLGYQSAPMVHQVWRE
jgi:sucrose-6-phosphate hydrolase SacC (GH32 family)